MATSVDEFAVTGRESTRRFQTFVSGNSGHAAVGGGGAGGGVGAGVAAGRGVGTAVAAGVGAGDGVGVGVGAGVGVARGVRVGLGLGVIATLRAGARDAAAAADSRAASLAATEVGPATSALDVAAGEGASAATSKSSRHRPTTPRRADVCGSMPQGRDGDRPDGIPQPDGAR